MLEWVKWCGGWSRYGNQSAFTSRSDGDQSACSYAPLSSPVAGKESGACEHLCQIARVFALLSCSSREERRKLQERRAEHANISVTSRGCPLSFPAAREKSGRSCRKGERSMRTSLSDREGVRSPFLQLERRAEELSLGGEE
ncbi:hypothetical protein HNY73_005305 [Argiope bruennichi]|uniref:Uncharacterized protein n=1 Tax=Argiope bruennichi TaxID=94029 RepID=A0A8T0FJ62_ARGBR|nr:hypothetical protein HNY73_005305 [Argiope bruennichi]